MQPSDLQPGSGLPGAEQPRQPQVSDTLERMLRPQGLFQNPQPKPFDWQQTYAAPPGAPGTRIADAGPGQATIPHGTPVAPAGYQPGGYPPGQYPPGQYPLPGQYPPGQYGAGQYGQVPYGAGPYGPGQLPPPFPPGPGFAPDGSPPGGPDSGLAGRLRGKLPKGPVLPVAVAGAAVLVVVGALLLSSLGGSSASNPADNGNSPTGLASTAPATASSASAQAQRQAAVALAGLLKQSGADRTAVGNAVYNVQSCGKDLAKDAQVFSRAAANRRALLAKLGQVPNAASLPDGTILDLTSAWQASAQADADLAQWAARAATHCSNGNKNDKYWVASYEPDSRATNSKQAFVKRWNRLAGELHLPTYTVGQL
jgi:hypothetical protein